MITLNREQIEGRMKTYYHIIRPIKKDILDIGIGGDEVNELGIKGGNYKFFCPEFAENSYTTMDINSEYGPDIVGDITKAPFWFRKFDIVICSQTLEHIFEYQKAFKELKRITRKGGYIIVDSPWEYYYHPEDSFGDYWRFSTECLIKLAVNIGLRVVSASQESKVSSILCQKV